MFSLLLSTQPIGISFLMMKPCYCLFFKGGTADVTAYSVEDDQSLRELHCASGKNVGGTNVDDLFFELLNDIFGENMVNEFKNNSPSDWLEMWRGFEVNKRSIGHNNPYYYVFTLPCAI